jgi:hypothetical protein
VIADLAPYGGGVRAVVLSAHVLQHMFCYPVASSFETRPRGRSSG